MKKHLAVLIGMVLLLSALVCVPARAGVVSWDDDDDGIPNDVEIAWGLDPANPADRWNVAPNGYSYVVNYVLGLEPTEAPTLVIKVSTNPDNTNADTTDLEAAVDQAAKAGGAAIVKIEGGEYLLEYKYLTCDANPPKIMLSGGWNADFSVQSPDTPTVLTRTGTNRIFYYSGIHCSKEAFVFEWLTFYGGNSQTKEYGWLMELAGHEKNVATQPKVMVAWCKFTGQPEVDGSDYYAEPFNGNMFLYGVRWILVADTLNRGCQYGTGLYMSYGDPDGYYQLINTTFEANSDNVSFTRTSGGHIQIINSMIWYWGGNLLDYYASYTIRDSVFQGFSSIGRGKAVEKVYTQDNVIMADPVLDLETGQLKPGSPAVGVGDLSVASPVDLLGKPRIKNDIGCMQRTFIAEEQPMVATGIIEQTPQIAGDAKKAAATPKVKLQIKRVSSKLLGKDGGVQLFFVNQATGKYYYVDLVNRKLVTKPVTRALKLKPNTWDLSSYVPKLPKGKFTANIKAFKKVSGKMKQFYWTNQVFNR